MLYREIIAVCSQIHTKHINALCGQNVELLNVKVLVQWALKGIRFLRSVRVGQTDGTIVTCNVWALLSTAQAAAVKRFLSIITLNRLHLFIS